jgi:hypothetical protein
MVPICGLNEAPVFGRCKPRAVVRFAESKIDRRLPARRRLRMHNIHLMPLLSQSCNRLAIEDLVSSRTVRRRFANP